MPQKMPLNCLAIAAVGLAAGPTYDIRRAGGVAKELVQRTIGALPSLGPDVASLKSDIIATLAPYGDPALNLPADVAADVDALARKLEAREPRYSQDERLALLDGRWRVRWSDAPPPSNGAVGPLRGEAYQVVDTASRTYTNELSLFGGAVDISLAASFAPSGDASLRVAFETLQINLLGQPLPTINFPAGTERTWLLTYSDDDTRLVRAGVDGGRSTARDLGLIKKGEGEAADAYLFVLTRAPSASAAATAGERRALKERLLGLCEGERLGAASGEERRAEIEALMDELAAVNPTENPAASPLLQGRFDIVWTTESELTFLTDKGFFGLPCEGAWQQIGPSDDGDALTLSNRIDFSNGFLNVGSACEPAAVGGRVNFRFESCKAKWNDVEVPLPPVGSGWFDVLYLDQDLRLCRDVRGDLQICRRSAI